MRCFAVMDVKFVSCFWELNEFDALVKEERFQKLNAAGQVGVLLCCDCCLSNAFVKPLEEFSSSDLYRMRTLHSDDSHECRIGRRYTCQNPACHGVQQSKSQVHYFSSWTEEVLATLPLRIQTKYSGGGAAPQRWLQC